MQGTQSRLNFLPEKHTDFIFTTLAEEFGFVGAFSLLLLYGLIIFFCLASALKSKDRFSQLLLWWHRLHLLFYLAVNLSMVMGMAPVVGCPCPSSPMAFGHAGDHGGVRRGAERAYPQTEVTA